MVISLKGIPIYMKQNCSICLWFWDAITLKPQLLWNKIINYKNEF